MYDPACSPCRAPETSDSLARADALEREITDLCARINAASYRLLELIAELTGRREVEAVIVDRAKSRNDNGTVIEPTLDHAIPKEFPEAYVLSLDVNPVGCREICQPHVPAIGRKHDRVRIRIDGSNLRLQSAREELIERRVILRRVSEL